VIISRRWVAFRQEKRPPALTCIAKFSGAQIRRSLDPETPQPALRRPAPPHRLLCRPPRWFTTGPLRSSLRSSRATYPTSRQRRTASLPPRKNMSVSRPTLTSHFCTTPPIALRPLAPNFTSRSLRRALCASWRAGAPPPQTERAAAQLANALSPNPRRARQRNRISIFPLLCVATCHVSHKRPCRIESSFLLCFNPLLLPAAAAPVPVCM